MTETGDDKAIGEQTGERPIAVAIILVVQIRLEREIGAVASCPSTAINFARLAHRQRSQQDGIDQTKDRGVRANPERHGENGERSEAGMFQKLPPAKANVLQQCFHGDRDLECEMRWARDSDSEFSLLAQTSRKATKFRR